MKTIDADGGLDILVNNAAIEERTAINAVDPGFTKTDLNGNTGTQAVEQGAEVIVRMAQAGPDDPTGGFFNAEGSAPW